MRKKKGFFQINILSLFFLCICFLPSLLFGQDFDNIGFRRDVPEEIRKAFPMCDEFLDVKWIDEKRYIGKLKSEIYRDGKKTGTAYFLAKLEIPSSDDMLRRGYDIFYDITRDDYYSKDFENFLSDAEYFYEKGYFIMKAQKGGIVKEFVSNMIPFYSIPSRISSYRGSSRISFSDFSKTICVSYPVESYAFIVETKKPFIKSDLSERLEKNYNSILAFANQRCAEIGKKCDTEDIKYCDAIDVNLDGQDDFIFYFNPVSNGTIGTAIRYIYLSQKGKYSFRPIEWCFGEKYRGYHKRIYYVNNKKEVLFVTCNLTEMMRGGDEYGKH
jgi:hypothetical protein